MINPEVKLATYARSAYRFWTRMLPVLGLFILAPFCAEYLIGYLDFTGDVVLTLAGFLIFAPLYGGSALIIREVTRRTKRGWLTMIMLAFAFGIFQAGMIDHSLFNPSYLDIGEYWQDLYGPTFIPILGMSAYTALTFVTGHVIWTICAPIAVVETFVPQRSRSSWLSNTGLTIIVILYVVASTLIFIDQMNRENFLPSVSQFIGTGLVVAVLLGAAFMLGKRPRTSIEVLAPHPWLVGAVAFMLLSLPTLLSFPLHWLDYSSVIMIGWPGVALNLALLTLLAYVMMRWSKMKGWNGQHLLALAGGALLTRAWIAFLVEPLGDVSMQSKLINNAVFFLVVVVLLAGATYSFRKHITNQIY